MGRLKQEKYKGKKVHLDVFLLNPVAQAFGRKARPNLPCEEVSLLNPAVQDPAMRLPHILVINPLAHRTSFPSLLNSYSPTVHRRHPYRQYCSECGWRFPILDPNKILLWCIVKQKT